LTQTIVRLAIQGRPNIYHATTILGDVMNQVQVYEGRMISNEVFFYYQPANQDMVYRARVRGLAFTPAPGSGEYWKNQRFIRGELNVIHTIWEGELTTLPLTNGNGTDVTTGLEIDNTDDATHDNWVTINDEDITGDAPTPAMIEITNTYVGAVMERVFIGHNVYSFPLTYTQILEGENAVGAAVTVNAAYSDGEYGGFTAPGGNIAVSLQWDLTANEVRYFSGNQFHVLLRLGPSSGGDAYLCYYYVYLANAGSALPIWLSEPLYLPSATAYHMEDLGVIRIPPWRVDEAGLTAAMRFFILIYSKDANPQDVTIDAVHLWAVDGYRDIRMFGGLTVAQNARLVDDMIEDEIYRDTGAATARSNTLVALGNTIMLQPGKDQRLYFVMSGQTGTAPLNVARTANVIVKYRPRRLAL
jgi:hypothetical protein